jgi:long-chain acyl-CoA synthetase
MNCNFTIYDMIVRNAILYPERKAFIWDNQRLTFADYKNSCDRLAGYLTARGTVTGDRIAVLSANSVDYVILYGAASKIGAVLVPLNWRLKGEEIEYILNDCTPKYLFSDNANEPAAREISATVNSIEKFYLLQDAEQFKSEAYGEQTAVSGDSPYVIIYTAAVGGKPKGCLLSQTITISVGLQMANLLEITGADCHICTLPLFHIGGISMTLATMHQGGTNIIPDRFDPALVLKLIEREKGTFLGSFPPMLGSLIKSQETESFDLSSLRMVCGVDSPETIERFLKDNSHAAFYSLYGQTEAMPISGCNFREKPGSIGRPALLTGVALLNESGREALPGETGEICVRSPAVFQGYWKLESETQHTLRSGWHHTGDLGRMDEDGFLWYMGRKPEKELIKPGGENVYPAEVEEIILSHPSVKEACVIGVSDPEWGEAVKAICVVQEGISLGTEELIEFVASKIARYKKPKYVLFIDKLPKTPQGTVDREKVKKDFA